MENMKIVVEVSAKDAVLNGTAKVGEQYWPMVDVLPLLPQDVREWLAGHLDHGTQHQSPPGVYRIRMKNGNLKTLPVPEVSNETVAAAIANEYLQRQLEAKAAEQKHETNVAEVLARPLEDWMRTSSDSCFYRDGTRVGKPYATTPYWSEAALDKDPRIAARYEEAKALAAEKAAGWQKEHDAYWAAKEAAKEAEAAAQEATEKAMREWVASCDALPERVRRAAAEGYEIVPTVKRIVGDSIREAILSIAGPIGGDIVEIFGTIEDSNRVPSDAAYAIHDALVEGKSSIASAAIVPGAEVTVGPFKRVDVSPSRSTAYRGAVKVEVTTGWLGKFEEYVLTEPADLEDDEDEDDED